VPYYEEPPESPLRTPQLAYEYPLILTTGAKVHAFFHSEHRQIPMIRQLHPDPIVEIHPETAKKLGIKDGAWVYIEHQFGKCKQKARPASEIHEKVEHGQHQMGPFERAFGMFMHFTQCFSRHCIRTLPFSCLIVRNLSCNNGFVKVKSDLLCISLVSFLFRAVRKMTSPHSVKSSVSRLRMRVWELCAVSVSRAFAFISRKYFNPALSKVVHDVGASLLGLFGQHRLLIVPCVFEPDARTTREGMPREFPAIIGPHVDAPGIPIFDPTEGFF
jgi:hypothetical protein